MGIETAALVIAIGATVGKMGYEIKGANEREEALELQSKQLEIQTQQKTLSNYAVLEKTLAAQEAHMTTTGAAFSSPSFNAIQRDTLNVGAEEQKNINLEGEIAQENIEIEKRNVRNSLYAQLFGDTAQAAMTGIGIYNKTPSSGASSSTI